MRYTLSAPAPNSQYIAVEAVFNAENNEELAVILPSWRPGRYEMGNFSKNVRRFSACDSDGNLLPFRKTARDRWMVSSGKSRQVVIRYEYYAAEINAGSSWLSPEQFYVNPVNLLVFPAGCENMPCSLHLYVPASWKLACSLNYAMETTQDGLVYRLSAPNFHVLCDSPFIASPDLKHNSFIQEGTVFHIWVQGEYIPDWSRLIGDFFIFINEHFLVFKSFPVDEYHFIVQSLPYPFYHGVEHQNSTVIAIGPGYQLGMKELWDEFLGVSSHELFHLWNVKRIRPADMQPYDYTRENYSVDGYIYEGLTTYYGDYLLFRSGIFSSDDFLREFSKQIQKHIDNPARFNYSVAESSFDTWLDGYTPGTPGRKVSIYTEGCLLAFIADVSIRRATGNARSLDDAMRLLDKRFGETGKGYTSADYRSILEEVSGISFSAYFEELVFGTSDYLPYLKDCLHYLGLEYSIVPAARPYESYLGFKTADSSDALITAVYPDSPADRGGMMLKDKVLSVNGFEVKGNLTEWLNHFFPHEIILGVARMSKHTELRMHAGEQLYYRSIRVLKNTQADAAQKENYFAWSQHYF